jgi:hypothetical protein
MYLLLLLSLSSSSPPSLQISNLKRELDEALVAGRSAQGLKEECTALKQELKLLKDERCINEPSKLIVHTSDLDSRQIAASTIEELRESARKGDAFR